MTKSNVLKSDVESKTPLESGDILLKFSHVLGFLNNERYKIDDFHHIKMIKKLGKMPKTHGPFKFQTQRLYQSNTSITWS